MSCEFLWATNRSDFREFNRRAYATFDLPRDRNKYLGDWG